jgi:hypothetical protein
VLAGVWCWCAALTAPASITEPSKQIAQWLTLRRTTVAQGTPVVAILERCNSAVPLEDGVAFVPKTHLAVHLAILDLGLASIIRADCRAQQDNDALPGLTLRVVAAVDRVCAVMRKSAGHKAWVVEALLERRRLLQWWGALEVAGGDFYNCGKMPQYVVQLLRVAFAENGQLTHGHQVRMCWP